MLLTQIQLEDLSFYLERALRRVEKDKQSKSQGIKRRVCSEKFLGKEANYKNFFPEFKHESDKEEYERAVDAALSQDSDYQELIRVETALKHSHSLTSDPKSFDQEKQISLIESLNGLNDFLIMQLNKEDYEISTCYNTINYELRRNPSLSISDTQAFGYVDSANNRYRDTKLLLTVIPHLKIINDLEDTVELRKKANNDFTSCIKGCFNHWLFENMQERCKSASLQKKMI